MGRYIDVDAALKRFKELHGNENELLNCYNADWIVSFIETQPTVDVQEAKHGKWEFIDGHQSRCSKCGLIRNIATQVGWDFCPMCGTKMNLEEEK